MAFAEMASGDRWRLRLAPLDGSSDPVDLGEFGGGAASYRWSPDGRSILVTHHYYRQSWLVDVATRTTTQLDRFDPGEPEWQRLAP